MREQFQSRDEVGLGWCESLFVTEDKWDWGRVRSAAEHGRARKPFGTRKDGMCTFVESSLISTDLNEFGSNS